AVHRAADPVVLRDGLGLGELHADPVPLQHGHRRRPDQPGRRRRGDPRPGHRGDLDGLAAVPAAEGRIPMSVSTVQPPAPGPAPAAEPVTETRRQRRKRERLEEQDSTIPVELYGLRRGTVTLLTTLAFLFAIFTLVPIA